MFSVSTICYQGLPGETRQRELDPLVGRIHQQQKAVVDNPFAIFIGHLQRTSVQQQRNGPGPSRIPGFIRHFIAVRVEPRDILLHQHQRPSVRLRISRS